MNILYRIFVIGLLIFALTGCVQSTQTKKNLASDSETEELVSGKPEILRPIYTKLIAEGERNRVLNNMRLGLNAFQAGHDKDATFAFNRAIEGIEKIYADSDQATKARSLWNEEGSKIFKGEAYERVMAYYYSGLLFLKNGDLQNARARFRGGLLQDAFADEEQSSYDFTLMLYLGGWCSQRITGDTLSEGYFNDLKKFKPDAPVPDPGDNVLLVLETGKSPRKLSDGVGHYQLKYRPGKKFKEKRVSFSIENGVSGEAYPVEDVYWQATTRGGRQFDFILEGKANFKKQTAAVGDALSTVGEVGLVASGAFDGGSPLQGIGAGFAVVGAVSQLASARAVAEADTRYWDNLPDLVHVSSLKLDPGNYRITLEYTDLEGSIIDDLTRQFDLEVPELEPVLFWARSRPQFSPKK